ncbi:MAG: hypothetical protein NTW25_02210, partial [Candidatus Kapabacteria bacterium]|nr:hypothetical protein [Candidatus Kapabacteria bacterium]
MANKAGISYEMAGKMLGKASDPENEAQLKRVGIVFQKGSSDAERYNKILEKLTPTMEQLKEQAKGPVGSIERFQNSLSGIQSAIGSSLIETLAPILSKLGNAAELVSTKFLPMLKGGLKELGAIITPVAELLGNAFTGAISIIGEVLSTIGSIIGDAFGQIKEAISPLTDAIAQIFTAFSQDSAPVFDFAEILKTVLSVVADVASVLIKLLVIPIKLVAEGVAFAITHFKDFVGILEPFSPLIAGIGASLLAYNVAVNFSAISTNALALAQGAYSAVASVGTTIVTAVTGAYTALANGNVIAAAKTYIFSAAQTVLNLVMSANPLGLIVIAIGALVAGLILAYKNSETFRGIIDNLWKKIKEFLGVILDAASAVGKFLGIIPNKTEKKIEVKVESKQAETNINIATSALAKYQSEISKVKDYKTVLNIQSRIKLDKGLTSDEKAILQDAIDEKVASSGIKEKPDKEAEKISAKRQKEAEKAFANATKDLANEQKSYEQEIKRNAAIEKRAVSEEEQLDIQKKKLQTSQEIAKKYEEIFKITTDLNGNAVIGIGISKEAKEKTITEYESLKNAISDQEIELKIKDNKIIEVINKVRGQLEKIQDSTSKINLEVEDKDVELKLEKIKKEVEKVNNAEYLSALEKSEKLLALEEETQALTTDRRIKAIQLRKDAEIKASKEVIDKAFNDEDIKLA